MKNALPTLMIEPVWSTKWIAPSRADAAIPQTDVTHVPMWLFVAANGGRVISQPPVDVLVRKTGPDEDNKDVVYLLSCEKLHVFASGRTYSEAEDLFHDQVVHFFYSYRDARIEDLDDDAAEIKRLYHQHFSESQAPIR